jgi:4-hydroxybutyrate CoA-transferase
VDFIYGASRFKGGKAIIGMPSTANIQGRPVIKMVPMLKHAAGVVTTRNHIRYVVTE